MANTVQQISDRIYKYMSEKSVSTTYDYTTVVLPKINKINTQICSGEMKDIVRSTVANDIIYKGGDLRFLRNQMYIKFVKPTATNQIVNPGDTTVNVGSTNAFASSGSVWLLGQIINYTGITPTSFTGCTGVIVVAQVGSEVRQSYEVPANADRTFQLFNLNQRGNEEEITEQDFKFNQVAYKYFKIVGDTVSSDRNYVVIYDTYTLLDFMLYYYRESTFLVNLTDLCDLPDNYGIDIISPICAGELMKETELDVQANNILTTGYANLHAFYNKFTAFNKKFRGKVEYPRVTGNYNYPVIRK